MSETLGASFQIDVTNLKKGLTQANRLIRESNSEFKAAAAGMGDWTKSQDGLTAKIKNLNDVADLQQKKVNALQEEYDNLIADGLDPASAAAIKMRTDINNESAALEKTKSEIDKYTSALNDMQSGSNDVVSASQKLRNEIQNQETEMQQLKIQYSDVVLEQGKNSQAANDLKSKINSLNSELNENKKKLNDSEIAFDDVADAAEDSADGFTVAKGALADLAADGIRKCVDAFGDLLTSSDSALTQLQASLGLSKDEMGAFNDEMQELYKNNYGESFEDIGEAMRVVASSSKETDPKKIGELAKNAITLRDTFDMDYTESMRAVNMLMDQFGISGEEAFNLIVQGANKGLNKNEDLLDSINEYGVHYKQLGYTADEFFNSLANGTDAGTFSVDKLGDAMKEFGIRTKDTAETTTEGFELIGLNADEMRKSFAAGGDTAQKATKKTLKALFEMDDQVKQNQAGVDLFGTMWEDLGIDGVKALMNVDGSIKKTNKSMKELDKVKYSDLKSELQTIGRTLKTDLLQPIVSDAMPTLKKSAKWATENIQTIKSMTVGLGATIGTVFVANKINAFAQGISGLITTMTTLKTATEGATIAQKALNLAQNTNVVGMVVTALGLLATTIYTVVSAQKAKKAADDEEAQAADKLNTAIDEQTASYNQLMQARKENSAAVEAEYGYTESLWNELKNITDENGKIKKGYEDRAKVITGILSDALGEEITIVDGQVQKYDELKKKISEVMAQKKAEAMLEANQEAYTTAIQNQATAYQNYTDSVKKQKEALEKLNAAQDVADTYYEQWASTNFENDGLALAYAKAQKEVDKLNGSYKKQKKATSDAQSTYLEYMNTIQNYEGVMEAMASGDVAKLDDAISKLSNQFLTADNSSKTMLENQLKNFQTQYKQMQKAVDEGAPGVTQKQVDAMKKLVNASEKELNKLQEKSKTSTKKAGDKAAEGLSEKKGKVKTAATDVSNEANKGLNSADTKKTGAKKGDEYAKGVDSKKGKANATGKTVASNANKGLNSADTKSTGSKKSSEYAKGVESKKGKAKSAGTTVAKEAKKGTQSQDFKPVGKNATLGVAQGMSDYKAMKTLVSSAKKIAKKAYESAKKWLDEHSPSKKTAEIGRYFTLGMAVGIESETQTLSKSVKKQAQGMVNTLQSNLKNVDIPEYSQKLNAATAAVKSSASPATVKNVKTANVNNDGSAQQQGVVVNQTNNYSQAHSRRELWENEKATVNAVKLALKGAY